MRQNHLKGNTMKQDRPGEKPIKHELLAPAGSPEICKEVIAAGADAVYLGGERYGARAFARNFSDQEILEALDFAHIFGRKIFLTVNTLLKNREMGAELYEYLRPFYEHGLDAVIVQDFGVFRFVKTYFPGLPVHASTQMSAANIFGAEFLKRQGASRIVTARELSLEEIRRIYERTGAEIESFVHGALCCSYSGLCLMSSLIGGRSGNRGRCAQPCRLPYEIAEEGNPPSGRQIKKHFPLSPKDLCALELLPDLCEAGVYSFKIEGRMKSLEYAAGVTQVYRKYLDLYEKTPDRFAVEEEDMRYLLALGNRSGFTRGYYEMRNGRSMMASSDSSHSSMDAAAVYRRSDGPERIPIEGKIRIREGWPLQLSVRILPLARTGQSAAVTVSGEEVCEAISRPLTEQEIRERISKTGDTPFVFSALEVNLDGNCFVPVRQMNELRRNALNELEQRILRSYERTAANSYPGKERKSDKSNLIRFRSGRKPVLNVQVSSPAQLAEAAGFQAADMISLDFSRLTGDVFFQILDAARRRIVRAGKQAGFCFPFVFRENTSAVYACQEAREIIRSFDTVWVRSYDSLGFCLQVLGLEPERISLDYPLYVYSREAYEAFFSIADSRHSSFRRGEAESVGAGKGIPENHFLQYTAAPELNGRELAHMPNEHAQFCLYEYMPMMVTAQCVYKNERNCAKYADPGENLYLTDRYFQHFYIERNCRDCYNILYNSRPVSLFHQAEAVKKLNFASYRITFVTETDDQIRRILENYRCSFLNGREISPPDSRSFTNGHFRRGVE
ncbi:MAG: U32 family peptidase [Clostridiales bacterium]|nr:U32 family peptidase [Clostridiales bacterium]